MKIVTNPELLAELGEPGEGCEWIADEDSPDAVFTSQAITGSLRDFTPEEQEEQRMIELAGQVANDNHLYLILVEVNPPLRRLVYDRLRPFLTFKPKPFWLMMSKPNH